MSISTTVPTTKTIFCIALEGEGTTGVNWFYKVEDRDTAPRLLGSDEVCFEIHVPFHADRQEITDLADESAWRKSWLTSSELFAISSNAEEDPDIDKMQAWSISAQLAGVSSMLLNQVPPEIAPLILAAKNLHPTMRDGAAKRDLAINIDLVIV